MRIHSEGAIESSTGRDYRFDFFRGLALIGIALNHTVPSEASFTAYGHYQFGHLFAFNFADVFVFVSGWVCGIVYGRVLEKQGFWQGQVKASRRAGTLFLANAAAAAACIAIIQIFATAGVSGHIHRLHQDSLLLAWLGTIGAYDAIPYFNILSLYMVFLLLLPVVLWLHSKIGAWVLALLAVPYLFLNVLAMRGGLSVPGSFFGHPGAWQFLFFGAAVLGRRQSQGRLPRLRAAWVVPAAILILAGLDYLDQVGKIVHHFNTKNAAGPVRIVQLLAIAYLISIWMPRTGTYAHRGWSAAIVRCGQESLFVFSLSLVTCYIASLTAAALDLERLGYLVLLGTVASVTILSGQLPELWRRRGTWSASRAYPARTRA